jgi:hypothetical protein
MLNMIQTFGPSTRLGVGRVVRFLRADSFSLISEMSVVYYPDLSTQCINPFQFNDEPLGRNTPGCVPYAGAGVADYWVSFPSGDIAGGNPNIHKSSVNATSLGYQLLLRGEYTNPFDIPITVNPSVGWLHDFHGVTPNLSFIEGRKAVTVSVEVDYLQRWGGIITYANFFGAGNKNLGKDRDFVSVSLSYAY